MVILLRLQFNLFKISWMSNMYEDSDNSSLPNEEEDEKLFKYHKLFKNYKQIKESIQRNSHQKESSKKSINSVQKAIQIEQQKNLQTRIALTEKQYTKARQNNILLLKKLSEAQEQNQYLKYELEKLSREKDQEIQEMRSQIFQMKKDGKYNLEKKAYQSKQRETLEIIQLNARLENKEKEINRLFLKIKSLQLDRKNLQNQIKNMGSITQVYKTKIVQLENNMNQVYLGQQSKGAQLLELDQARQTIERLVFLLRNTEEFKKFANFAQEFKEIHFLKNAAKSTRNNVSECERRRSWSGLQVKTDERILWSPSLCYKIMLEMKLKHEQMSEACIQQCLFELNKVWLAKEETHVSKIKESYECEISRLKKKTQERYDELVARKQIQRLKKELQQTKFSRKVPSSNDHMDLLKNIGQYEDELRLKQREIKLLQDRIKLMETQNNNYDKVLYLEGALWIIDKILDEIQENNQEVNSFETKFRDNCSKLSSNQDWTNAFKDFFEAIQQINNCLVQKVVFMKDSTLKKMGNQRSQQLKESSLNETNKRM